MVANGNTQLLNAGILPGASQSLLSQAIVLPTLDEMLRDCGTLFVFVEFEGIVAMVDGDPQLYRFVSDMPPGADPRYVFPWLLEWPDLLEEQSSPFGGLRSASELT